MKKFIDYLEEIQELKSSYNYSDTKEKSYSGEGKSITTGIINFKHNEKQYTLKSYKKTVSSKAWAPAFYDGPDEWDYEDDNEIEGKGVKEGENIRKITTFQLFENKKSIAISKENENIEDFLKKHIETLTEDDLKKIADKF